mgnify:FL=1
MGDNLDLICIKCKIEKKLRMSAYCKVCKELNNELMGKCTHKDFNKDCVTCRDTEAHAGYATKEGFANFDAFSDWSDKVEYYNRPEPEPDEPSDDDFADRVTENEIADNREGVNKI